VNFGRTGNSKANITQMSNKGPGSTVLNSI
jgi:hypothetical protein